MSIRNRPQINNQYVRYPQERGGEERKERKKLIIVCLAENASICTSRASSCFPFFLVFIFVSIRVFFFCGKEKICGSTPNFTLFSLDLTNNHKFDSSPRACLPSPLRFETDRHVHLQSVCVRAREWECGRMSERVRASDSEIVRK